MMIDFDKARSVNILDYMQALGENLVQKGPDLFTWGDSKTGHDSFQISPSKNVWHWWSRSFGGQGAWDFIKKVEFEGQTVSDEQIATRLASVMHIDLSYDVAKKDPFANLGKVENTPVEAVEEPAAPVEEQPAYEPRKKEPVKFPNKSTKTDQLYAYLCGLRKISPEIVDDFIARGMLYESNEKHVSKRTGGEYYIHNAVWIWRDAEDKAIAANKKGLRPSQDGSYFSGFELNSDKENSMFTYPRKISEKANSLVLFEADIDLMSYLSLHLNVGHDYTKFNCASLGGISENMPIPKSLETFFLTHPMITNIYIGFDNDEVGRKAAKSLGNKLTEMGIKVSILTPKYKDLSPSLFKDWNDVLVEVKRLEEHPEELQTTAVSEEPGLGDDGQEGNNIP